MAFSSRVRQITTDGSPGQPCYELSYQDMTQGHTYMARNFGIAKAAAVNLDCNWKVNDSGGHARAGFGVLRNEDGEGLSVWVAKDGGTWTLAIGTSTKWIDPGSFTKTLPLTGVAVNTWYRMHIGCTINKDSTVDVVATVRTTANVDIASAKTSISLVLGDYCGFHAMASGQWGSTSFMWVDNIRVTASGATEYVPQTIATSYVYTYVNDLGEESAPSPASAAVLRPDGIAVTVTFPPPALPAGTDPAYGIVGRRLYRAVNGASGAVFLLVADEIALPLATTFYLDTADDSAVADSDVLESDEWDPPPDDLEGILALPNGIMAGFVRNQLCLSAAGRPHAWPVRYRQTMDTDIVAIANIDNTIVIGTKSFLYTATGNSPDSYSMSKPGEPQACVSKRSMVFLPDVGVVYASPDGWMVCTGSAGQVKNATEGLFTKRQWTALTPASIISAVHDGVLFFFCGGLGYALDTKASGFGLVRLGFSASAVHVSPLTDALYLVLSSVSEPTASGLPLASTAVTPNGRTLYQFDAGASDMVFRWRGRLNLTPYPLTMGMLQVRALNYTNLLVRIYGNGALIYEKVLANAREFTLPVLDAYDSIELELMGTSSVRTVQAAEDVSEMT